MNLLSDIKNVKKSWNVRESNNEELKKNMKMIFPDLNPKFIFTRPAFNVRNNEIGAIIGMNS